jgi:hypothetical protein
MFTSIRKRITPGLVVAVVALVAALGGTATAAKSLFISKSSQIKNGAVTSADIKNGTVQQGDLGKSLRSKLGLSSVAGQSGANGASGVNGANGNQGAKGDQGPQGPQGPAGSDAIPSVGLSSIASPATTTNDSGYDTVTGLSQTVTIPDGPTMRVLATISGESSCYGATGWCVVRVLIDGTELTPASGTNFSFNSTSGGTENSSSWESMSVQRYSNVLAPGDHSVVVQQRVTAAGVAHRFDDAVLSTMLVRG